MRDLLSRCLRWQVGIGWYLLAFPGLLLATLLVASVFLGTAPLEALAQKWPLFFTRFLPALLIPFALTQLGEETGWTGFMQDTLQERHAPLRASLMVAPAFALYHLPFLRSSSDNPHSGPRRTRSGGRSRDSSLILPAPYHVGLQRQRAQRAHRGALPQRL